MLHKSTKKQESSADRAVLALQPPTTITDEQRQRVEEGLAKQDQTWEGDQFRMPVPMEALIQTKISEIVGMFPEGAVRLETDQGDYVLIRRDRFEAATGYGANTSRNPSQQMIDTQPLTASN